MTASHDDQHEPPTVSDLPGLAQLAGLGLTMACLVAAGVGLGLAADHLWHSAPVGLVVGLVLGSLSAASAVITLVRRWL